MRLHGLESSDGVKSRITAFYQRVTAEESFKRNLSIPAQRAEAEELAHRHGWAPFEHYTEPKHVQASVWQRPAFLELVRDIEAGKILRVVARHEDRFWRDLDVQQRFVEILRRHQVEFWVSRGQLDYKTAHGKLVLQITGATAEFEKNITGERIRKVKRSLIMRGRPAGGPPPFGYTSQSRIKRDLMHAGLPEDEAYRRACEIIPVGKSWMVDEREAELVRLVFGLFTDPGHRWGVRRITAYLNRHGHRRRSGLLWHPDKVRGIVNNPAVAGHLFYDEAAFDANVPSCAPKHQQQLYPGSHEPIITLDVWREAQRIKAENTKSKRTKTSSRAGYPLRDILICGCGKPMKGKASGGDRPAYYICSDRKHFGAERCSRPVLKKPLVEAAVWSFVRGVLGNPIAASDYMRAANEQLRDQAPPSRHALAEKKTALTDVKARLARYHERFARSGTAGEENVAWPRIKELGQTEEQLRAEVAELEAERIPNGDRGLDAVRARRHLNPGTRRASTGRSISTTASASRSSPGISSKQRSSSTGKSSPSRQNAGRRSAAEERDPCAAEPLAAARSAGVTGAPSQERNASAKRRVALHFAFRVIACTPTARDHGRRDRGVRRNCRK